jgi:hypothetical protein
MTACDSTWNPETLKVKRDKHRQKHPNNGHGPTEPKIRKKGWTIF